MIDIVSDFYVRRLYKTLSAEPGIKQLFKGNFSVQRAESANILQYMSVGTKVKTEAIPRVKVRLNIRLWKETKERLRVAAEKLGVSETDIMEMALRMWFTKEKIS